MEVGGRGSAARRHELSELSSVAVAQHLDANPFARAALATPARVSLSTASFELLLTRLQEAKLWLLLAIVNSHLRFEVLLML